MTFISYAFLRSKESEPAVSERISLAVRKIKTHSREAGEGFNVNGSPLPDNNEIIVEADIDQNPPEPPFWLNFGPKAIRVTTESGKVSWIAYFGAGNKCLVKRDEIIGRYLSTVMNLVSTRECAAMMDESLA